MQFGTKLILNISRFYSQVSFRIQTEYEYGSRAFKILRAEGVRTCLIRRLGFALTQYWPNFANFYLNCWIFLVSAESAAYYDLAVVFFKIGRTDEALSFFKRALNNPENDGKISTHTIVQLTTLFQPSNPPTALLEFSRRVLPHSHNAQELAAVLGILFINEDSNQFEEHRELAVAVWQRQSRGKKILIEELDVVDIVPPSPDFVGKCFGYPKRFEFREPYVFEDSSERPCRVVKAPGNFIAKVNDASVIGAFAVKKGGQLINFEPALHPKIDISMGSKGFIWGFRKIDGKALIGYAYESEINLRKGILIGGRYSRNFFHWLIEDVPKALAVEMAGLDQEIPIIIDKNLGPQHKELVSILFPGRPVFQFDHQTLLQIDELWLPSIPTHLPDDFINPYWTNSAISEPHMTFLRDKVIPLADRVYGDRRCMPKVYLSRNGLPGRRLVNENKIEKVFMRHGFEIVRPETMGFLEQVKLFREAEVIAGPGGAAFANSIFCRPGTKLLALTSDPNKGFCMHSVLSDIAKANFTYVTGPTRFGRQRYLSAAYYAHADFFVKEDKVERALKYLGL